MQRIRQQEDGTWHATYGDVCRVFQRKKQAKNWCGRQARNLRRRQSGDFAVMTNRHAVMTFAEVGQVMGLSRRRVEQIEKEAISKLRLAFTSDGTKDEAFGAIR